MMLGFPSAAIAQSGSCTVVAGTLGAAHDLYDEHCTVPRRDCDPINGQWYCSSESISASSIPDNVISDNQSQPGQQGSSGGAGSEPNSGIGGPCIDADGDGWGWNGASCRVSASADNGASDSANGASVPTTGSSTCVDADGDGWGWNGSESCRVSAGPDSGAASSVGSGSSGANSGACVDDDGDGWGWNGRSSCRVSGAQYAGSDSVPVYQSSDITDLVLLTGQSNALGANTGYSAGLDSPDVQVFAFTNNGWRVADLHQVWDRGWHPRNDPDTDPSNNLLLHFGKRVVSRDDNRVVGFILASEPGAAISNWDYNGAFYRMLESKVLDAINQLPHKSELDGVLWHQGETDANDTAYYSRKLTELIANFRAENWYSSRKPFICGEIAHRGGVNNRLNQLNSDGDSYTACVSAAGLSTREDGSHFDAAGLRELGRRYADRYYSMTR